MKVRDENDPQVTENEPIDDLSIGFSYNMMADSLKLSTINTSLRLKLGKSQTFSLSATWDPYLYELDSQGRRCMSTNSELPRKRIRETYEYRNIVFLFFQSRYFQKMVWKKDDQTRERNGSFNLETAEGNLEEKASQKHIRYIAQDTANMMPMVT